MEKEFWEKAWDERNIGFHLSETNAILKWAINNKTITQKGNALVPLCGKSLDLIFLKELGLQVYGVEIAKAAVLEFFTENNLDYICKDLDGFTIFEAENITIFCGDFFNLPKSLLPEIHFIYDRASNVALPPSMRDGYYNKIIELSSSNTEMLLVTAYSKEEDLIGPPFSIPKNETMDAYQAAATEFKVLKEEEREINSKRLRDKGIKNRVMAIYYLKF